jgi:hypothetical protein
MMLPAAHRSCATTEATPARGFPWLNHLTIDEADECARLERPYWEGVASWHEADRLRVLRAKRLRAE